MNEVLMNDHKCVDWVLWLLRFRQQSRFMMLGLLCLQFNTRVYSNNSLHFKGYFLISIFID